MKSLAMTMSFAMKSFAMTYFAMTSLAMKKISDKGDLAMQEPSR